MPAWVSPPWIPCTSTGPDGLMCLRQNGHMWVKHAARDAAGKVVEWGTVPCS